MENKLIPQSESSLGFFGVIRESFKTISTNGKLLVPILLLMFLSYSQLEFAEQYTLAPIINHFMLQLANHPNIVHDLTNNDNQTSYVATVNAFHKVLLMTLLFIVIRSVIMLVFLVATVSSSYEAYTAKVLGPKDMFLKISKCWKRPIVTSFYLILLSFGITFFYAILTGITAFFAVNSWGLLLFGVITLSIPLCYFYVATLWMVSLIVSVLEEGSNGLKAIGRAAKLMNGKRLQASLMMVVFTLADSFVIQLVTSTFSSNWSLSSKLALTITFTNGFDCSVALFMFVVYTVFYHEWKTSHDEKERKVFYLSIENGEA